MALSIIDQSRPWNDRSINAAGVALIVGVAGIALSLFSAGDAMDGGWLLRAAVPLRMLVLVLLATALLRAAGETWRDVGLTRPASWLQVAALVIGGYLAVGALFAGISVVLPALGLIQPADHAFSAIRGDTAQYLFWLLPVAWGSAAFGEELVFRGYVQSRFERLFGTSRRAGALAAVAQALVFGVLHAYLGLGGAVLAAAAGLVLGVVYFTGRRNLWACIILHGLIDTVSLTAFYIGAA